LRTLILHHKRVNNTDKTDYLILSELERNAALSFVDIAKNVGATPCTVKRRYEKMKKEGIIFGCIVSINLGRLGYHGKTFLMITLAPHGNKSDTISYLRTIKNVLIVTQIIGPYDIMAIAPITDIESIRTLLEETRKAPNIQRVEFSCINNVNFPVNPNYGTMLSQKSQTLSNAKQSKRSATTVKYLINEKQKM
jgi:Lrp/AsnC family transcriptional regulator, leucine-responsive regulatory protein